MPSDPEVALVADAVTALLVTGVAAHAFSIEFTPVRRFISTTKLEDLGTLHVDVVPVGSQYTLDETRTSIACSSVVEVAVRKRFEEGDLDAETGNPTHGAVDGLLYLGQEIIVYLAKHRRLTSYEAAVLVDIDDNVAWSPRELKHNQQFTGIACVVYESSLDL